MATLVWAHRGASAYAPENTLPAFEKAIQMGSDGIELDVHMSLDGELVVIHDETVDRTSNGTGAIADMTLEQLKKLDFSNGFTEYTGTSVPTLPEVYQLIGPTGLSLNVEIKCDVVMYWGIWDKLTALEREMNMQGRILYSSFNHDVLPYIRALDPKANIGLLYSGVPKKPWRDAVRMRANAVHPNYMAILRQPNLVRKCHENGIAVHTWTVNDPAAMQSLSYAGVEAIITNKPDIALAVVKSVHP